MFLVCNITHETISFCVITEGVNMNKVYEMTIGFYAKKTIQVSAASEDEACEEFLKWMDIPSDIDADDFDIIDMYTIEDERDD